MNSFFSKNVLQILFADDVPPWLMDNLDFELIDQYMTQFKLVCVLPFGMTQPVRVTWSSKGEEARWIKVMQKVLPPKEHPFLLKAPPKCRKVYDTNGYTGEVFLDDLYDVDGWEKEHMATIYSISQKSYFFIQKLTSPLGLSLSTQFLSEPIFMGCLTCGGLWGVRRDQSGNEMSILWVSEAKWKQNIKQTQEFIESKAVPALWWKLKEWGKQHTYDVYPDAIEFFPNGRIDLSVMFEK
jgi:hypothetical protein